MEEHEKARNNDWTLMAHYMLRYYKKILFQDEQGHWAIRLRDLQHLCSFETLRRSRQIIQNDHMLLIPTDPKVRKARKIKEKNMREAEVREAVANPQYKD